MSKLTAPQRALLQSVVDGLVWESNISPYDAWVWGPDRSDSLTGGRSRSSVRRDVLGRLIDLKLAHTVEAQGQRWSRAVAPTAKGLRWLSGETLPPVTVTLFAEWPGGSHKQTVKIDGEEWADMSATKREQLLSEMAAEHLTDCGVSYGYDVAEPWR